MSAELHHILGGASEDLHEAIRKIDKALAHIEANPEIAGRNPFLHRVMVVNKKEIETLADMIWRSRKNLR